MRRFLLLVLLAVPLTAAAQSSQFGVRGLGQPGRSLSAGAIGSGGAFGMFDSESSLNPAALDGITAPTAVFTGVQALRSVENPAGSESLQESRFPLLLVAGPVRRFPLALGVTYTSYTSRDFTLATTDTLALRDVLVPVNDTLSSRGGISDLRLAASYRVAQGWAIGGGFHILTGSNRVQFRRAFADDSYLTVNQQAELSYAGVGVSLGTIRRLGPGLAVAALLRSDRYVGIDRDSARVSRVDLPYTFGLGVRYRLSQRLELGTQGLFRTWSGANSDLLGQGAPGARNTVEVSLGGEYLGDPRRPFRRPIRFGARYGTLPFPLSSGARPEEFGVSLGSGARFAQQRAGIDLALEYLWRSAGEFKERAFVVTVGVTVRP
ncbi:MAG: hypothetical protein H0T68_10520 [Gemmatimonadales bacterium]|nr:hypothetical protein [Gemmatimonadales bacterium]